MSVRPSSDLLRGMAPRRVDVQVLRPRYRRTASQGLEISLFSSINVKYLGASGGRKPFDPTTKLRMASVTPDETACAIFMAPHARPSNRKPARRGSHAVQSHANRCLRALAIGVGRQRHLVGR